MKGEIKVCRNETSPLLLAGRAEVGTLLYRGILARGVAVCGLEMVEVTAAELEVLPEILLTDDFVLC